MIHRVIESLLHKRLSAYPAVTLVGPRQCGKTTLSKSLAASQGGHYFDLEQTPERSRLDAMWAGVIAENRLVVFDEAQSWPELFPRLRGAIDADRATNGRFLLLGSFPPFLMASISESLAGRMAIVYLSPFLLNEFPSLPSRLDDLWFRGGLPDGGILQMERFPGWQSDYLVMLAHRDLPRWGLPAAPQQTLRLLQMLAALHGQMWNASRVGRDLGLAYHTINAYLNYLEGAFLIRRLHPFQADIRKRLVKSPKVYWRDTGLLHSLLGVSSVDGLFSLPRVGASWEGFVIEQILNTMQATGLRAEPYFLRTSDNYELDLILDWGVQKWALEIKLTSSPGPSDLDALNKMASAIGADKRILVSRCPTITRGGDTILCDLPWLLENMSSLAGS